MCFLCERKFSSTTVHATMMTEMYTHEKKYTHKTGRYLSTRLFFIPNIFKFHCKAVIIFIIKSTFSTFQ